MPRGDGTLSTVKCGPALETHRVSNARGLPGGRVLADGIDLYIRAKLLFEPNFLEII